MPATLISIKFNKISNKPPVIAIMKTNVVSDHLLDNGAPRECQTGVSHHGVYAKDCL